eukprot:CAMPEP_0194493408 /NCGR_PEP_ID=MMETSP0253-20130528/11640_1 /TAXON_ID=2966 /ORGANISM="Noctiluca scintillans" /LENGTH=121 /DNA_ID=CAMNT_0039334393 /DNA_START=100 /DNA_END=465 /DNA_ORIENTATION=+
MSNVAIESQKFAALFITQLVLRIPGFGALHCAREAKGDAASEGVELNRVRQIPSSVVYVHEHLTKTGHSALLVRDPVDEVQQQRTFERTTHPRYGVAVRSVQHVPFVQPVKHVEHTIASHG